MRGSQERDEGSEGCRREKEGMMKEMWDEGKSKKR